MKITWYDRRAKHVKHCDGIHRETKLQRYIHCDNGDLMNYIKFGQIMASMLEIFREYLHHKQYVYPGSITSDTNVARMAD